MGLARTLAVCLTGMDGSLVEVEADISAGLPGMSFTGLADTSVVESRERLRAAVHNSGAEWPNRKITVALLPADKRKRGSRFDLAVGIAVLAAAEQVKLDAAEGTVWIAELGLDGRLRPVHGVLPSVLAARRQGARRVVVAIANAAEAALVTGIEVRAATRLDEIVEWLGSDGPPLPAAQSVAAEPQQVPAQPDLVDVAGQHLARRALEIASAGGHHLYMVGTPGAGKTMLAERMPGLLPPLSDSAALEVTAVHSVAGLLDERASLLRTAPLQAPHHTASTVALVGGGSGVARPGAISLAHHGVLFLDEVSLFKASAMEALREPLEKGHVVLARGGGTVRYPARFQLVLATNPCPCAQSAARCNCESQARRRHLQRLSGPLMDRVDLHVQVEPVPRAALFDNTGRETTAQVAARVAVARSAAARRWSGLPWQINGAVPGSVLRGPEWMLPPAALRPVERFFESGSLSARGFDRILRVAWTIADLSGRPSPEAGDISEALAFRTGQFESWAA